MATKPETVSAVATRKFSLAGADITKGAPLRLPKGQFDDLALINFVRAATPAEARVAKADIRALDAAPADADAPEQTAD